MDQLWKKYEPMKHTLKYLHKFFINVSVETGFARKSETVRKAFERQKSSGRRHHFRRAVFFSCEFSTESG